MECWKHQRKLFDLQDYDDPFKALYDLVRDIEVTTDPDNDADGSMNRKMKALDIIEGLSVRVNQEKLEREGRTEIVN